MLPSTELVDLSRLQFGATALYHFLFVPLTLGLVWILFIMEAVYVMTGKQIYKDMTRFWGKLFAINFAMGVTTGITLEFQFGTNWAYYAHYVGDIFAAPLALEGMFAFFLESTFVGIFFFGWDRLSKVQHLFVTFLVAVGSNFSALWVLVANAWMQNPVGAHFNYETMRMEVSSFSELIFNPVAQVKFVHTVAAGYVAGAVFVLGVSCWYLLKKRDVPFALRSIAVASGFGLASIFSVILLGDESGYTAGEVQKVKLAAIESEWKTEPAPAAFTVIGLPNQSEARTDYAVKIPYVLGLIATRSLDEEVTGLNDIMTLNEARIRNGMLAYRDLQRLKSGDTSDAAKAAFDKTQEDLGFGLLLKKYTPNVVDASEAQIKQAARDTIPNVFVLFWSFRVMVAMGLIMLLTLIASFYFTAKRSMEKQTWLLRLAVIIIPAPWIAGEFGWVVAEMGRQPWTVSGILPTHLSSSSLSIHDLYFSLAGLIGFYTVLLAIELYLMFKYARLGPSSLHTGQYHFETVSPVLASH